MPQPTHIVTGSYSDLKGCEVIATVSSGALHWLCTLVTKAPRCTSRAAVGDTVKIWHEDLEAIAARERSADARIASSPRAEPPSSLPSAASTVREFTHIVQSTYSEHFGSRVYILGSASQYSSYQTCVVVEPGSSTEDVEGEHVTVRTDSLLDIAAAAARHYDEAPAPRAAPAPATTAAATTSRFSSSSTTTQILGAGLGRVVACTSELAGSVSSDLIHCTYPLQGGGAGGQRGRSKLCVWRTASLRMFETASITLESGATCLSGFVLDRIEIIGGPVNDTRNPPVYAVTANVVGGGERTLEWRHFPNSTYTELRPSDFGLDDDEDGRQDVLTSIVVWVKNESAAACLGLDGIAVFGQAW